MSGNLYEDFKLMFRPYWEKVWDELLSKAKAPLLFEPIRELASEGKRLRPYLVWIGAGLTGKRDKESALRLGMAVEMVHTFALVHDDIIDRSETRRHKPTVHRWFEKKFKKDTHFGISAALLAGDALLAAAFDYFYRWQNRHGWPIQVESVFHLLISEVIAGEYVEHELTAGKRKLDENILREIASLKSGRYTMRRPLELGLALGGVLQDPLSTFAELAGIAFQVQDDVLGIIGDSSVTGKSSLSDILERKRTMVLHFALKRLTRDEKKIVKEWYASDSKKIQEAKKIRKIISQSGAPEFTWEYAEKLFHESIKELKKARVSTSQRQELEGLISMLSRRKS